MTGIRSHQVAKVLLKQNNEGDSKKPKVQQDSPSFGYHRLCKRADVVLLMPIVN
jgi:hypothetical protein